MPRSKATIKKRVYKKQRAVKKEFIFPLYFGWQIRIILSKIKNAVVLLNIKNAAFCNLET